MKNSLPVNRIYIVQYKIFVKENDKHTHNF